MYSGMIWDVYIDIYIYKIMFDNPLIWTGKMMMTPWVARSCDDNLIIPDCRPSSNLWNPQMAVSQNGGWRDTRTAEQPPIERSISGMHSDALPSFRHRAECRYGYCCGYRCDYHCDCGHRHRGCCSAARTLLADWASTPRRNDGKSMANGLVWTPGTPNSKGVVLSGWKTVYSRAVSRNDDQPPYFLWVDLDLPHQSCQNAGLSGYLSPRSPGWAVSGPEPAAQSPPRRPWEIDSISWIFFGDLGTWVNHGQSTSERTMYYIYICCIMLYLGKNGNGMDWFHPKVIFQ